MTKAKQMLLRSRRFTFLLALSTMLSMLVPITAGADGTFTDDDGSVFESDIEWLAATGITKGCNPPTNDRFCPTAYVTRGQMAAFLVRALGLTDDGGGDLFTDDDGSTFEADIDKLGTAGVTSGCNPPANDHYCPNKYVTRGQMAAFLVRALGYTNAGTGDLFTDDDGSTFESDIDKLGTAAVTKGCNPPANDHYCPNSYVTRGQMAAFLHRALEPATAPMGVEDYLRSLPDWDEFSPPVDDQEGSDGETSDPIDEIVGDVTYSCTTTPYSITKTPERIVTLDPDNNILWVGALLQGDGYKDGIGSLLELPIRQRAPVVISIDLLTDDTTRTIVGPTVATVQQGIGELIAAAEAKGAQPGTDVYFVQETTHSVEQSALKIGLSANYLSASVKSTLESERSAAETTVTAYFVEKAFTVSMVQPQTPGAVFSDEFTEAVLAAQGDRISETNIPVYVDSVTYGRILMFSFTSSASEAEIRGTLSAVYETGVAGGSADLTAEQKEVLSQARIEVITVGGGSANAVALIRSGELGDYFADTTSLSTYRPISYTVRNLGDNSLAKVGETTSYNVRECTALPKDPTKIGETAKVTLDHLHFTGTCDDSGNGEIYGFFHLDDHIAWHETPSTHVSLPDGALMPFAGNPLRDPFLEKDFYYEPLTKLQIRGQVWDDDPAPNPDDLLGTWIIDLYLPLPYDTPINEWRSHSGDSGCSAWLAYHVEKVKDIYE